MTLLKVKKLNSDSVVPKYAQPGDAGLDLYSAEDYKLQSGERHDFHLGFATELPDGYAGLVWDKGGVAQKHGVHCLAGVLDSGYRGELVLVLLNTGSQAYEIKKGDKIAQLLIQPVERADIKVVDSLSATERGQGRFGSTGKR